MSDPIRTRTTSAVCQASDKTAPRFEDRFTEAELRAIGMLGAIVDAARGTLTFQFTNRDEVWTLAPDGYPIDGSREVLRFSGEYYVPPPDGVSS